MARWENDTRWYEAHIQRDLWGQWTVMCCWGGKHRRHNGNRTHLFENEADALLFINFLDKKRSKSNPPYLRVS